MEQKLFEKEKHKELGAFVDISSGTEFHLNQFKILLIFLKKNAFKHFSVDYIKYFLNFKQISVIDSI